MQFVHLRPLRKGNWFGKRWKTLIVGGGILVTISGCLIALGKPLKGRLFIGKKIDAENHKFLIGEKCLKNISGKSVRCYFIDNKSKQTLWLLGDSHSSSLSLAGEKVANSLGMNLKRYSAAAMTFPPVKNI